MTFRTRLLIAFAVTVAVAVSFVGAIVSTTTRRAFERLDQQRVSALAAQFHQEYFRRQREIAQQVRDIADAESTRDMVIALSGPDADPSIYVDAAQPLATAHNLDFLELVSASGSIVSSAQWPARFLYQEDWVKQRDDWNSREPFLYPEELPTGGALALISVRVATVGDSKLYVIGGQSLGREFLQSVVLPAGMRALLYREPQSMDAALAPLIDAMRKQHGEVTRTIQWSPDAASAETFHAIPLMGPAGELMGAFLVGSSRAAQVGLERFMVRVEILVAVGGILLALLVAFWTTARITRPVEALAAGARAVAAGDWHTQVQVHSYDEIGALAAAFNQMTRELLEQRDRLVQAERVAAWRELARRLAHELKNPLFPLQITVENLQRARAGQLAEQASGPAQPDEFDEIFRESTATLLAELGKLRGIVGRFSDFAKMPQPQLETVDLNGLVHDSLKLFEAQMWAAGVELRLDLAADLRAIRADPGQLGRALQNLVMNAIDAMPSGGVLSIRSAPYEGGVRLEVSDTGQGLTQEECDRLFTPYYTTKTHGTGLGLAIVQSVVSDHGGKIGVDSAPGKGTTFCIDLAA